jgi:transposase InsO family protein
VLWSRDIIEAWRQHYNQMRARLSLGYHTLIEFRRRHDFVNQGAILK